MELRSYTSANYVQLRQDIERCAAQLALEPELSAKKGLDAALLSEVGARLSHARQTSRQNARHLLATHLADFPESPLFSTCSLLGPIGQGRREVSVTQVLGWLLDPNADHGFGGLLLRAFLSVLVETSEAARYIGQAKDGHISVYTEFALNNANRVDVLIVSQGNAVVVEAKVDALEGHAQTERYLLGFEKAFPVCTCVYLTPRGSQATSSEFISLRYIELARALIRTLPAGRQAAGFHYARYFIAGLLQDLCGIFTSSDVEEVLRSNIFALETLLETHQHD